MVLVQPYLQCSSNNINQTARKLRTLLWRLALTRVCAGRRRNTIFASDLLTEMCLSHSWHWCQLDFWQDL